MLSPHPILSTAPWLCITTADACRTSLAPRNVLPNGTPWEPKTKFRIPTEVFKEPPPKSPSSCEKLKCFPPKGGTSTEQHGLSSIAIQRARRRCLSEANSFAHPKKKRLVGEWKWVCVKRILACYELGKLQTDRQRTKDNCKFDLTNNNIACKNDVDKIKSEHEHKHKLTCQYDNKSTMQNK